MILSVPTIAPKLNALLTQRSAPIITIIAIATIEFIWACLYGYRFSGLLVAFLGTGILLAVALVYGVSGRSSSLSNMAYFGAAWVGFSIVGAISTYIFTTLNYPLLDENFKKMDAVLGFDWLNFYEFVERSPSLSAILKMAYDSLQIQIVVSIIYLSSIEKNVRSFELWWTALIALTATATLSGLFPAAGTFQHYGVGLDRAVHLSHFYQLREGLDLKYVVAEMHGIVTFPSYHVVLAILLTYAVRNTKIFILAAIVNTLMLVSTPIYGGHYLVDMIAGGAIAILSIWFVQRHALKEKA